MPHSYGQVYLHVIWSTKNRIPFLKDESLRQELYFYLAEVCRKMNSPSVMIGGVEDHVHIACRLGRNIAISDLVRALKRASSKWIKTRDASLGSFYWQQGYAAFSISPSHVAKLHDFIADQVQHHRKEEFDDEFRRVLKKYGVEYDESLWD